MLAEHTFSSGHCPRRLHPSPRRNRANLREAIAALAGHRAEVVRHGEQVWASATFTGSHHKLTLTFAGVEAVAAAEQFIAALPDHEFTLPGQIVAEARVVAVDHTCLPEPRLTLHAEILLLDDI